MRNRKAIVCTTPSDSHTWNLVILDLFLQEKDFNVVNLGSNTPYREIIETSKNFDPDLIVVSSLNGHAFQEGLELIRQMHSDQRMQFPPLVIGGRASTDPENEIFISKKLKARGFDETFFTVSSLHSFDAYLSQKFHTPLLSHAV